VIQRVVHAQLGARFVEDSKPYYSSRKILVFCHSYYPAVDCDFDDWLIVLNTSSMFALTMREGNLFLSNAVKRV
jgi:hypothetical protein